jgi:hypothetical protein
MTPGNAANIRERAAPRRTVDSGLGARTAASHGGAAAAHLSCCPPRQREGACAAHRDRARAPTRDSRFTILTARTRRLTFTTKSPAARRRGLRSAEWPRRLSSTKGYLLYELDRKDGALRVCDEMVARFGTANEPKLRGMMEGILSAKKTSLASSRACPPAWDLPNELRNTAQPRPEILSGIRAPDLCSLLPPPYRKRPQQVLEL